MYFLFFYGPYFHLWSLHFSYNEKSHQCYIFSLFVLLHCYSEVAPELRFRYFCFSSTTQMPFFNRSGEVRLKAVVFNQQSLILLNVKRDVQLKHCIVPSIQICQKKH